MGQALDTDAESSDRIKTRKRKQAVPRRRLSDIPGMAMDCEEHKLAEPGSACAIQEN